MLALRNLLSNAVKFSRPGGEVRIRVSEYSISVSDDGIGIPEAQQDAIFRTKGSYRRAGTAGELSNGLGLAVSRQLIEALGGSLTVLSREGEGSTFTIKLPLDNA